MATTLTALSETLTLSGTGSYTGAANAAGGSPGGSINLGSGSWAAMIDTLTFGTGNNQVNQVYIAQRTVAAGSDDNLDLSGSLKSPVGDTIAFTKIKLCVISIVSPDGTKSLRVGPNGVSNAFQGPWGAVTANVYNTITNFDCIVNEPIAGYTVTDGTGDILPIHNPGAGSVTYNVIILGLG